jgi:hypothetical protein
LTHQPAAREQSHKYETAVSPKGNLRTALILSALLTASGALIGSAFKFIVISSSVFKDHFVWLTTFFFQTQDRVCLVGMTSLFLALAFMLPTIKTSGIAHIVAARPRMIVWIMALGVFAVGVFGAHAVFNNYDLSRDEILADFDSIIFRTGKFAAVITTEWRPFAAALQPRFMLPIADGAFASAYLPVNAVFRAIMGSITSPLLAAAAIVATFGVARRLWPTRVEVAVLCAVLVATSSQVLITSMTSYAMTAHLALNMIWLWLFLRDDKVGHSGAIASGFLACGLHQLVFHPLFAAPFIARLWLSGRRPLALIYLTSYVAICLFWILYWKLALTWQGLSLQAADDTGPTYFAARVLALLAGFNPAGADLMLKNILRFVVWQSPALLPLSFLAYQAIRRDTGIARELLAGILLTLAAMFILLPFQGHGWGYRYLHGLIGSAALLSGYGWIVLSERTTEDEISKGRMVIAICSAFALFVLLPIHAIQAHYFVLPYFKASEAIARAPTDVVVIDTSRLMYAEDLVRNDPFLRNHPKVLDLLNLSKEDIERLCSRYSGATFDYDQAIDLGMMSNDQATAVADQIRAKSLLARWQGSCGAKRVLPLAQKQ